MDELEFHLYTVSGPKGVRRLLSVLPHEENRTQLPPESVVGELTGADENITPDTFVPNQIFGAFLQWVIMRHGPAHETLKAQARIQKSGHVLVVDRRTVGNSPSNVPPRDVLGRFDVKDGALHSYHMNPEHQLCSEDGLLDVDAFFQGKLLEELRALSK